MSFCFNFVVDESTSEEQTTKEARPGDDEQQTVALDSNTATNKTVLHAATAKEILISSVEDLPDLEPEHQTLTLRADEYVHYVESKQVEHKVLSRLEEQHKTTHLKSIVGSNSDLVPCIYEGGLKIWECSLDLVNYLAEERVDFRGKKVLELGCGAALPGLYAAVKGACVTFQDYNEDVVTCVTIPNFKLNRARIAESDSCRFFSGDWTAVAELLDEGTFDYILTSETIYSKDTYDALHSVLSRSLKKSGVIYLAAKTYYFGVGGGTRDFERYLAEKGLLESGVCREFMVGVNREILQLKFRGKDR